ncbi:MAG: hypothetical protein LBQ28_05070 [Prevotellaceae bacterium]|jgi:hypothetical protein|nr:hypothetical protein [Prevotellaceae bacterium]
MKKILMILVVMVGIAVSANAKCVSDKLVNFYGNNYVRLENKCSSAVYVTIKYYEKASGKWITPKRIYLTGNGGLLDVIIYDNTQYQIVREDVAN